MHVITAAGGVAELMLLPDHGVAGNSHYTVLDTNSLEVATLVDRWIMARLDPGGSNRPVTTV